MIVRCPTSTRIDKLPAAEIKATLHAFMEPVLVQMPEKRLQTVAELAVQGILGGQSPLVTQMARGVMREEAAIRPAARRLYRLIWNRRFSHRELLKGLYGIGQRTVPMDGPSHLIVALDPVNLEKPYARCSEGVSTMMKHTTWGTRAETTDVGISSDDSDNRQPRDPRGDICQLVFVHKPRLCQRESGDLPRDSHDTSPFSGRPNCVS